MRSTAIAASASTCTARPSNGPSSSPRSALTCILPSSGSYPSQTSVRLRRNKDDSLHFFSTEAIAGEHNVPCKVSCNVCRSPLLDEGRNTVLAYPSSFNFPDHKVPLDFQPTAHIFYSQRVMEVPDGVPKWSGHKGESELLQELTAQEGSVHLFFVLYITLTKTP